jgi:hypothetical protein
MNQRSSERGAALVDKTWNLLRRYSLIQVQEIVYPRPQWIEQNGVFLVMHPATVSVDIAVEPFVVTSVIL